MKQRIIILVLLIYVLSACGGGLEYRYYTKINSDGSIYKRIIAVGDSSSIYTNPFSFDTSNGWTVTYDKEINVDEGDTLFLATVEQTFISFNELNGAMFVKADSVQKDNIIIADEKQFAWFFTFHTYSETFVQRFPYRHVSINDYVSDRELAYLFEGDTTCMVGLTKVEQDKLDEKAEHSFWKFISQSIASEFISLINDYEHWHPEIRLSNEDSLFINQLLDASIEDGPELPELCVLLDKRIGGKQIVSAYEQGYFNRFEEQIEDELILLDESDYVAEIESPSLLYDTNAEHIDGNLAKWEFKRGRFLYKDYILYIKYRTTNVWSFIITLFAFVSIFVLAYFIQRKNK